MLIWKEKKKKKKKKRKERKERNFWLQKIINEY